MTAKQYQKIYDWFMARPKAYRLLKGVDHYSVLMVVCFYVGLVVYKLGVGVLTWGQAASQSAAQAQAMQGLLSVCLVPAVVYLAGTFLRARLNWARPYEQPGFTPLVAKQKKGHSFPSRHAVSASAIAVVWWYTSPVIGLLLGLVAIGIAVARVLAGVHYVRDVLAGLLFGGGFAAFALVTFYMA